VLSSLRQPSGCAFVTRSSFCTQVLPWLH
jgi:hypothetical protein